MSSNSKKVLLIGGLIGFLLGVVITYFLFPKVITKNNLITSEKLVKDTLFVEKDKIVIHEIEKKVIVTDTVLVEVNTDTLMNDTGLLAVEDTVVTALAITDSIGDTLSAETINDSLEIEPKDSTSNKPYDHVESGNNIIRVSKNELLYVMQIKPEGNASDFYCRKNKKLDSLLMDNYTPTEDLDDQIRVEFWASPLNSVGYVLNKNRLVLFGFYQYNRLKLKYLENGTLQMNYINNEYVLQCSDVFQSLIIKEE